MCINDVQYAIYGKFGGGQRRRFFAIREKSQGGASKITVATLLPDEGK